MAIYVITDASVSVAGTDLSDHVESAEVSMSANDVDITAMGASARNHAPGLRDDKITLNMFQDFAASSVDDVLNALVGVAAGATVVVKPTSATVSATNPSYTMVGALLDYTPIGGKVGDASMTPVVFVPAQGSQITRATA